MKGTKAKIIKNNTGKKYWIEMINGEEVKQND